VLWSSLASGKSSDQICSRFIVISVPQIVEEIMSSKVKRKSCVYCIIQKTASPSRPMGGAWMVIAPAAYSQHTSEICEDKTM
jgi:hypothetical protein